MSDENMLLHELCYAPNLPQMTRAYDLPCEQNVEFFNVLYEKSKKGIVRLRDKPISKSV